jgi:hypothetical protein
MQHQSWGAEGILDFLRFMNEIEPLLTTRTYASPGPLPMTCASCHGDTNHAAYTAFPIVVGQTRNNYTETARRVSFDSPDTSILLLKPLALAAGGLPHGTCCNNGGEQFANTTTDTAYIAIQSWIREATTATGGARISRTESYPNPFRFKTNIVYFLNTEAIQVDIRIFTFDGHEVRHFVGTAQVGANQVEWDGRDTEGEPLNTGVYFYSIKARFEDGTFIKAGRIVYTP